MTMDMSDSLTGFGGGQPVTGALPSKKKIYIYIYTGLSRHDIDVAQDFQNLSNLGFHANVSTDRFQGDDGEGQPPENPVVADVAKVLKKLGYPEVQVANNGPEVLAALPKATAAATKQLQKLDALREALSGEGASQVALKKFACTWVVSCINYNQRFVIWKYGPNLYHDILRSIIYPKTIL